MLMFTFLPLVASLFLSCSNLRYSEYIISLPSSESSRVPQIEIDERASGMEIMYARGEDYDYERSMVLPAVENFWNKGVPGGKVVPAKITITGKITDNPNWGWFCVTGYTCAMFLFGVPTYEASSMIDLKVETHEKTYSETGSGKCYSGLYYPKDASQCAFAKALAGAVNRIKQKY